MPFTEAQLKYQVCPIILTGGVAGQIPGGMLPMLSLFAQGSETNALGLPFDIGDLDDAFGAFNVLPGGTLVSQTIGKYPFANQWVAANAVIREPLTISVIMDAPMRGPNAWIIKQSVMTALKGTLDQHNNRGGTYTVATPAYMYDNLIMTSLTDNSRGNNSLPQNAWRFDFERPLVALTELQEAQNQFTQKLTNQLPQTGSLTGINPGLMGSNPTLAMTIKTTPGGLSAGYIPSLRSAPTTNMTNYPALPNSAGFPYAGIS
jgi:hypothetical protein